jgi:hypothetical protein
MHNLGKINCRSRLGMWSLVLFVCAVSMTLLSGCTSLTADKKKSADPILGEVHPQGNNPYGPAPPTDKKVNAETTGQKSSMNVPNDPVIGPSPTSNAYLASITKPLPGSQALAINDGKAPGTFQLTANAEPLVRPVPKDPAFVNGSWVAPPTTPPAGSGPFTAQPSNFVDPQTALLQARGVTQHRVDPQPNGSVRLIAVAPQSGNPSQLRTYDVVARDYAAAVQAVLQQMEQGK